MGTHGHRGIAHVLLGSVAEKILRLSRVPVLNRARFGGGANVVGAPFTLRTTQ